MIKPKTIVFNLFLLVSAFLEGRIAMTKDFEVARELSETYRKPIVLFFSGSDWCKWSQHLGDIIFRNGDFEKRVGKNLIFVQVDFPEVSHQNPHELKMNHGLKEYFHINSFPTLVLLSPDGDHITTTGYLDVEPGRYGDYLLQIVEEFSELEKGLKCMRGTFEEIRALYAKAKVLGSESVMKRLLNLGLKCDKKAFFHMEKYTALLNFGEYKEAQRLREKLSSFEGEVGYRLAVLDFQSRVSQNALPEKVIEPLLHYIQGTGKADKKHLWRLHLLISQYLFTQNRYDTALKHAESAYASAPREEKSEPKQAVSYLKTFL